jgi:hypothetical protein
MAAHCVNIRKIMDDITMSIENNVFNGETNLALSKIRAEQRKAYIKTDSISYISNLTYSNLTGATSTY